MRLVELSQRSAQKGSLGMTLPMAGILSLPISTTFACRAYKFKERKIATNVC